MERAIDPHFCLLNAVFYRADTLYPLERHAGMVLFNHTTGVIENGPSVKLQTGGIYTTELINAPVMRFSKSSMEKATEQKTSFASFKNFTIGRSTRRGSESLLTMNGMRKPASASKGSIVSLKGPDEPKMVKMPSEETMAGSSSFFTIKKKKKSIASDSNSSDAIAALTSAFLPPDEAEEAEDVDLLSFLKGADEPRASVLEDKARSQSDNRHSRHLSAASSMASLQSSNAPSVRGSMLDTKTSPTGGGFMTVGRNSGRQSGIASSTSDITSPTKSPKKATVFSLNELNSLPACPLMEGNLRVELNGIYCNVWARLDDYVLQLYSEPDDTQSRRVVKEIFLAQASSNPIRNTSDYSFVINTVDEVLHVIASSYTSMVSWISLVNTASCYVTLTTTAPELPTQDGLLEEEVYRKEYNTLLALLKDETGLTEAAALTLCPEIPPEFERQGPWITQAELFPDSCIAYQPKSDGELTPFCIRGATIEKLVERLADHYGPDMGYINTLFYTYRHFTDAKTWLNTLIKRMHVDTNEHADLKYKELILRWKPIIKLRVVAIVFLWIKKMWSPDFVDESMGPLLLQFIQSIQASFGSSVEDQQLDAKHAHEFKGLAGYFSEAVRRKETAYKASLVNAPPIVFPGGNTDNTVMSESATSSAPNSEKIAKAQFLDLDPKDIAGQLTILEHDRFASIKTIHYFLRLWGNDKELVIQRETSNLNAMVNAFNTMSYWVATEVCTQPELKNRVKVIERFIKIGRECKKYRNFEILMAIISGLNLVAVSRLKATWEVVEPKRMKQLAELESFMSPNNNYKTYRAELDDIMVDPNHPPFIPILGIFLKDLLFLNDGNPKTISTEEKHLPDLPKPNLINVEKLKLIYSKTSGVTQGARSIYNFPASCQTPSLASYCSSLRALKEQALYKYSCLCEPKQSDENLRLREKWMNNK